MINPKLLVIRLVFNPGHTLNIVRLQTLHGHMEYWSVTANGLVSLGCPTVLLLNSDPFCQFVAGPLDFMEGTA